MSAQHESSRQHTESSVDLGLNQWLVAWLSEEDELDHGPSPQRDSTCPSLYL